MHSTHDRNLTEDILVKLRTKDPKNPGQYHRDIAPILSGPEAKGKSEEDLIDDVVIQFANSIKNQFGITDAEIEYDVSYPDSLKVDRGLWRVTD